VSINIAYAQIQATPEQTETLQELSPEQRKAIEIEINKTGGVLTPETIKSLKERPEFKGLIPEDIIKGKEILEKKEKAEKKEQEKEKEQIETKKTVIEEEKIESLFNRYRTVGPYQDISTALRPFGYEFFSKTSAKSLIPRKDIPVSSDYIIGPGDEVKILLWGRVNAQYNLLVDRDGNITIPRIGPLQVAGMRFDDMKDFLTDQAKQIVGANMNVTMGRLKSIQVFVLGEVRKPSSYALDSFSTITTAILAAGGPTEIGSLRNIQLKRNNKNIAVMDFYDFLLKGDKQQDKVLQSGDVIFVPTVGPLVGIAGNVKRPAIYELKNEYDLMSLFKMAGGIIPSAYTQQIQVERIQKNERQIVIDINDKNLTKSKDFMLQDGDLIKVFPIVDKDINVVFLGGNVKRPGKYEYKPGMRVKDLIKDTTDLLKETYFEYALIKRLKLPTLEAQLIPFNLGKLLFENDADNNVKLEPQDSIYIFSKWFFKDRPFITVEGEVRRKGTFDLLKNYRLKDAILEAGGLTKDANLQKGEIFRLNEEGRVTQIYFNVGLVMAEIPEENILLQDKDRIIIHSIWEEKYKHTVSIDGDVKNPGEYPLVEDMHISDLIFAAGNILESAYLDEAEVSSQIIEEGKLRIKHKKINLKKAIEGDPTHNLLLKPYDRVFVKRIPEWQEKRFVNISGEINFPGKYIIKKGERLSSLIERAGGFTDKAYLRGAVFTRERVKTVQQKSLEEMILRLESELLAEGSIQTSTALSQEEIEAKKVELEQKQKFIEALKKLKATGRMSIKLTHPRLLKGSEYDIELEDGDNLHIPMKNNVVNVVGSVMSRGSFVYSERLNYKDYIEMAGGYSRYADTNNVYVLKVDGSARKLSRRFISWNHSKSRWEMSGFGEDIKEIEPGDTIVVPEKLERIAWLRETKDLTQILYQIAVTTGVILVLF
jgi:protein involved in polysaccharide export with SLBB domain